MRKMIKTALLGLGFVANGALAQNIVGTWYGTIEDYNGYVDRMLVVAADGGKLACTFDLVGVTTPAKCSLDKDTLKIVTAANNVVQLALSGDRFVGTFTFTSERKTYPLKMSRTRPAILPACQQEIPYTVVPPAPEVPPEARMFSGVWLGVWGGDLCGALIVEDVKSDGTATTIYAIGSNGINAKQRRRWVGRIVNGTLSLRDNGVFVDLKAVNANELSGSYNTRSGNFRRQK